MPKSLITIGLISDTHMPFRWENIPEAVFDCFADVDFIIHAGDVGEMWVLDTLSRIAPVVAVHGNDEGEQAKHVLPFQHTLVAAGQRIVVTHGHFPDHQEEMEGRKDDNWHPKLARWANFGKRSDAQIVIYGHTHIPMALQYNDVLLINPGAIASGGVPVRQTIQSVARLTLQPNAVPVVEHFDLSGYHKLFAPHVDVDAGFVAARDRYQESVLSPELDAHIHWLIKEVYPLAPEPVLAVFTRLLRKRWTGELPPLTLNELMTAVKSDHLPQAVTEKLRESPTFALYLQD